VAQVYRNDSSEKRTGEQPRLAHAVDFPVTMWMPVAPEGYVALGTIVQGAPMMPDTSEVLCLRADLAAATRFFDSPIWRRDPPALQVTNPAVISCMSNTCAFSPLQENSVHTIADGRACDNCLPCCWVLKIRAA
jgi:hypothetical protein